MFFVLSKLFYALIAPLTWVLYAFAWAWISARYRRKALLTGLGLLYLISNPLLVSFATRNWEGYPVSLGKQPPFDLAIVLTGGIVSDGSYKSGLISFGPSADRLLQPLLLYKRGKVARILISGGSGRVQGSELFPDEGKVAAQFLSACGVDSARILLESASRNTHENTQFTAQLLKQKRLGGRLLLVTSALHMPRAAACFRKAGLTVTPYPVDFRAGPPLVTVSSFWPSVEALYQLNFLVHEWVGYLTYRMMGYC
ncbi:MAG: YdcF family protein [Sphingobacteriaceae bacterium]|nr:YdcF family protein [Cytophagaceae bacterium]